MAGTVKKLQFSEGTDVGAPTDLSLETSTTVISPFADDSAYVASEGSAADGSVYLNTTTKKFRYYLTSAWRNAVPESDASDATKTFLLDLTGCSTGVSSTLDFNNSANRTYTFPNASTTMVGTDVAQTLSSKTLATPIISGGSLDVPSAGSFTIAATMGANDLTLGGSSSNVAVPGSLTVTGNTILTGNLTVNGTQTILNTTTLEVEDVNILINNGGDDTSAQGAGITVERSSTNGTILFDSALASKWKLGLAGAEVQVADVSTAQTFSNKTLSSCTINGASNTISNINLTSQVTGTLPISSGGTGQTSQTSAFDALAPSTTKGDIIVYNGTDNVRLGVGTNGFAIVADSAETTGLKYAAVLTNPMDSAGDIIVGGSGGTATKLDAGASNTVLIGGTSPSFALIANANVDSSAAIAGTKISPDFGSQTVTSTGFTAFGNTASDGVAQLLLSQASGSSHIRLTRTGTSTGTVWLGSADGDFRVGTSAGGTQLLTVTSAGALTVAATGGTQTHTVNGSVSVLPGASGNLQLTKTTGNHNALVIATGSGNTQFGFIDVGSGRTYVVNDNDAGGTNNLIQFGFGTVTSGSPNTIALKLDQSRNVTMPGYSTGVAHFDSNGLITSSTITNSDISASAAIDFSKLATLSSGNIILGNGSNVATSTAVTGDVTINSSGVTAISSGVIVDGDVNASAAIAGTKISPNFGSQNISTTGTLAVGQSTIGPAAGDVSHQINGAIAHKQNNTTDNGIASYRFNPDAKAIANGATDHFDTGITSFSGLVIVQDVSSNEIYFVRCGVSSATLLSSISFDTNIAVAKSTGAGSNSRLALTNNTGATHDFRCLFFIASGVATN